MTSLNLPATALLVTATLLAACGPSAPPASDTEAPQLRPVRVAKVEQGPALPPIVASGVVAARDEAKLSFKLGGLIREITVREGEAVRAGQLLARLETAEIDAGVAQARAAHDKARRDLQRGQQLFKDDVITQEQLDDLGTAAEVARAQLSAAEFNRRYADITAPADGRVLRRLAEPRELVSAGQPVLMVSRGAGGFTLKLGLPDRDFVHVALGDTATVAFDAFPGHSFAARVIERGEAADPRSGTFPLELELDTGEATLASGLIGRAEIAASSAGNARLDYIPLSALVEGNASSMLVFLYDPASGKVRGQQVAVAFITEQRAALSTSLPNGAMVVAEGAPYLHDGDAVRTVE